MIDLRSLRPLDTATILASIARTHRAVVVDECWRTGSFAAKVSAQIIEHGFYDVDGPVQRLCSAEVPIRGPDALCQAPGGRRPAAARNDRGGWPGILGADMTAGTLIAWRKRPGGRVARGDIIAEVETEKGLIDVEVFVSGVLERILVELGATVPTETGAGLDPRGRALGCAKPGCRGPGRADRRPGAVPAPAPTPPARPRMDVARMRQAIAAAMARSKREIPTTTSPTRSIFTARWTGWPARTHVSP